MKGEMPKRKDFKPKRGEMPKRKIVNNYDASSIKVMDQKEAETRFIWVRAHEIANQYKKPLDWVERCLETCGILNVTAERFIAKYITHTNLEEIPNFSEVHGDVVMKYQNMTSIKR